MTDKQFVNIAPEADKHYSKNIFEIDGYDEFYDRVVTVMLRHMNRGRIKGAKIIDLACGYGGFGKRMAALGADIYYVDGREGNLAAVKQQFPDAKTYLMNVEKDPFPSQIGKVDLVMCMGLIYHVSDPSVVFKKIAEVSSSCFVESTCLDHDGEAIVYLAESTDPVQFSLSGSACRPSPGWISTQLSNSGFASVQDVSHKDANMPANPGYPGKVFDWKFERTCGWRRNECVLRKLFLATNLKEKDGLILT